MNTVTEEPKITPAMIDRWLRAEGRQLVMWLLAARAHAIEERKRVNAYEAPIFARYEFTPSRSILYVDGMKPHNSNDPHWDQFHADARLIAAAPDLLEACQALFDAPHQEHFIVRLNDEEMAALDAIKVAIAKAKGF